MTSFTSSRERTLCARTMPPQGSPWTGLTNYAPEPGHRRRRDRTTPLPSSSFRGLASTMKKDNDDVTERVGESHEAAQRRQVAASPKRAEHERPAQKQKSRGD